MRKNIFWIVAILCFSTSLNAQEKEQRKASDRGRVEVKDLPVVDRKIEYKKVGDKSFYLHVYEPKGTPESISDRPALVFFFGGGWNSGDPKQFYTQCRTLADLGMVAMSAEYRVASRDRSKVVDCIADAQDAMLYVRSHAKELKIDPKRIAAGGGSAGGHLAAAVATIAYRGSQSGISIQDYRPNALVLFNPALVLAPTGTALDKEVSKQIGSMEDRVGDKPETASPYHHVNKELPTTIIFHGRADTTVPFASVDLFREKAKRLGVDCRLMAFDGEAHGFFNVGRPKYDEVKSSMVSFLRELKYVP